MAQYYVIKNDNGDIIKDALGRLRFFNSAFEAMTEIESNYGNSPYLTPEKWSSKRNHKND